MIKKRYVRFFDGIRMFIRFQKANIEKDIIITQLVKEKNDIMTDAISKQEYLVEEIKKLKEDKTKTLEFKIDKVDFISIDPIIRDQFLKILEWYYLLRLQTINAAKTETDRNEICIRANEIFVLYTELTTVHKNAIMKLNKINEEVIKENSEVIRVDNQSEITPEQQQTIIDEQNAKKSIL